MNLLPLENHDLQRSIHGQRSHELAGQRIHRTLVITSLFDSHPARWVHHRLFQSLRGSQVSHPVAPFLSQRSQSQLLLRDDGLLWRFLRGSLSPIHAYLVMTQEYFTADMGKLYRLLIPPVTMVFSAGLIFLGFSFWIG